MVTPIFAILGDVVGLLKSIRRLFGAGPSATMRVAPDDL
mgnify:CR=1 FL=1|jgi:hypothetical protein